MGPRQRVKVARRRFSSSPPVTLNPPLFSASRCSAGERGRRGRGRRRRSPARCNGRYRRPCGGPSVSVRRTSMSRVPERIRHLGHGRQFIDCRYQVSIATRVVSLTAERRDRNRRPAPALGPAGSWQRTRRRGAAARPRRARTGRLVSRRREQLLQPPEHAESTRRDHDQPADRPRHAVPDDERRHDVPDDGEQHEPWRDAARGDPYSRIAIRRTVSPAFSTGDSFASARPTVSISTRAASRPAVATGRCSRANGCAGPASGDAPFGRVRQTVYRER